MRSRQVSKDFPVEFAAVFYGLLGLITAIELVTDIRGFSTFGCGCGLVDQFLHLWFLVRRRGLNRFSDWGRLFLVWLRMAAFGLGIAAFLLSRVTDQRVFESFNSLMQISAMVAFATLTAAAARFQSHEDLHDSR